MRSLPIQAAVASLLIFVAGAHAGTLSYKAIPATQSDAGCGVRDDNYYTTAVDGGNTSGQDRTVGGISFDALNGPGKTVTANDCTVNALSGTLSNAKTSGSRADGTVKQIMSDMLTVQGAGDNSQQEIVLGTANMNKGTTYDLRIYIGSSSGQNRQVNLAFVGNAEDAAETGFFNEDDATTSPGAFSNRNDVYYINFRYTWDGDVTPGVTITQKSGAAPFCLYAVTNQEAAQGEEEAAGNGSGQDPTFAFIDMGRVFKEYGKTKDAEAEINAAKGSAKKEYDSRSADYRDELARIKSLSGSERDKAITKLKEMEQSINAFRASREKELQDRALKMREQIVGEITAAIKRVAGDSTNLIFDSSGMSNNGVPFLKAYAQGADITDKIVAALNDNQSPQITPLRGLKIGMLSMNDVFKGLKKTKDSEAEINQAKAAAKKEYDNRAEDYKRELAKVNSSSGEERDEEIVKVKEMEKSINEWRAKREKELQDQAMSRRGILVSEIKGEVEAAISTDEPTLLFDSSGMTLNGVPAIITTAKVPDFSDQIVSALNQGGKKHRQIELASSADLRFACVDLKRVFSALPETKKAEAEINRLREEAKDDLADSKKKDAKEKELQEIAQKKREPIVKRITANIRTLSDNAGYNVVLDRSGNSLNGVPVVILTHDLPDLTDDVIARLR